MAEQVASTPREICTTGWRVRRTCSPRIASMITTPENSPSWRIQTTCSAGSSVVSSLAIASVAPKKTKPSVISRMPFMLSGAGRAEACGTTTEAAGWVGMSGSWAGTARKGAFLVYHFTDCARAPWLSRRLSPLQKPRAGAVGIFARNGFRSGNSFLGEGGEALGRCDFFETIPLTRLATVPSYAPLALRRGEC